MNELEFSEVVAAVCQRPRMYTPFGTVAEVISYLEGYAKAAKVEGYSHWGMAQFNNWVQQKERSAVHRWEELLNCRSNSETDLGEFAQLYRDYAQAVCNKTVGTADESAH